MYLTFKRNFYMVIMILLKGHHLANPLIKDFPEIWDVCHI